MFQRGNDLVIRLRHRRFSLAATSCGTVLLCTLVLIASCKVHAQTAGGAAKEAAQPEPARCLPAGNGYLRARLSGTLKAELNWGNEGTDCTGAVRPTDGGIRMRFSRPSREGGLVLLFGIAKLREGESARGIPVNLTVMKEGTGEFYSTQGDDKCMLDEVKQEAVIGMPHRSRVYRVVARGFCTEPARAVRGKGSVLVSRFDYAGRVDFETEDRESEEPPTAGSGNHAAPPPTEAATKRQ